MLFEGGEPIEPQKQVQAGFSAREPKDQEGRD
jgi:hypothetical protein